MSLCEISCKIFQHPSPEGKNKQYIENMESSNSVGIHIRRGDYLLSDNFRGICEVDYYKRAIDKILQDGEKHVFYLFSNDQNGVKSIFYLYWGTMRLFL